MEKAIEMWDFELHLLPEEWLEKHFVLVHEGKNPLKCDICDRSCSQKYTLNQHLVHIGKKPT